MKRERLKYLTIEYFIYWNSTLPKFPLEIVNVLSSDVRYAERFRYYPEIALYARYDYLSVPNIKGFPIRGFILIYKKNACFCKK